MVTRIYTFIPNVYILHIMWKSVKRITIRIHRKSLFLDECQVAFWVLFLNVLMLCFMYVITIYMSYINKCIENSTLCLDFRNSSSRDWNKNNYSSLCCVNTYGSYYCVEYDPIIKPSPPPTKAITIGMSF